MLITYLNGEHVANWNIIRKSADFEKISNTFGIDPVIARILRNRELIREEEIHKFLYADSSCFYSPFLLLGMERGVSIIIEKIRLGKKIRVIGDYDIDGVCSAYILMKGLRTLGAEVDVAIPERMTDGYGLNERLINDAAKEQVDTIVTCDNGIAAVESVLRAKEKGMTIIVTDHHEVPYLVESSKKKYILPQADAIINPKQEGCDYPMKGICGAFVAYKLIEALMIRMNQTNDLKIQKMKNELMGFAAFATIGDVMELTDENRILVKYGLQTLEHIDNLGMKELIKLCDLENKKLEPYHVGFILGPCINAVGRLDTAQKAIELFLCNSKSEAYEIAMQLKNMNEERKRLTLKGIEDAHLYIHKKGLENDSVLVIYLEDCHESIAGIIAGRIREAYNKPTFVLTKTEGLVKGSGRSIPAYSMYDEMVACRDLFEKFGGHKAAAGLSIKEVNVAQLRHELNQNSLLTKEDFQEIIRIDVEVPLSYVSMELLNQISLLEPFGTGNVKPVFAIRNLDLILVKKMGTSGKARKLLVEENKQRLELIAFGEETEFEKKIEQACGEGVLDSLYLRKAYDKKIHVVYQPSINEFRGKQEIQFILNDIKSS